MKLFSPATGRAAALLALAALFSPTAHAQSYLVTDLGTLGGASSIGLGVNNSGQVTGHSNPDPSNANIYHAFLYSKGAMTDLGTFGGSDSEGTGINDAGQITGFALGPGDHLEHAFLYSNGTLSDLGSLTGAQGVSWGYGINSAGQVVGFSTGSSPQGYDEPVLFSGGTITDLGALGGVGGYAYGINDSGQITGRAETTGNAALHAFLYSNGVMSDLGTLGGAFSIGRAINASGQVTGNSYTSNNLDEAFVYHSNHMYPLGVLPGFGSSQGWGIDSRGQVVGTCAPAGYGPSHAFLYSGTRMIDLNSLISPKAGLVVTDARSISDTGFIAGYGDGGLGQTAFLLTPNIVLSGLSVSPNPIAAGTTALGKVSLRYPVYVNTLVTLTAGTAGITVPISVTIPALKTYATFPVTAGTAYGSATLTAKTKGPSGIVTIKSASVTVGPVDVDTVTLSPAKVTGGSSVVGTLTLNAPAPAGGLMVSLSSSNTAVAAPGVSSLTVPAGSKSATFPVKTFPPSAITKVTLSATASGLTRSAALTVTP